MEINRCMGCMSELNTTGRYCPVCGFDNQNIEQPSYALRCYSILHGRYLIGRVLGRGGFGITYIGLDLTLNIKVAIKEYYPMGEATREQGTSSALRWNLSQAGMTQRQKGYDSFLKEARKMAKIDQIPSIVRVRDTFLENETAYIVMDYVEGITLKEKLLKNGTMTFSECMELLSPIMEGLEKVHKQGMIHRDISPDNIMVQPDGSVRLLDLGAAKDMTTSQGPESQLVTKKGFSPLEQYMDAGKIGPWTDVYALCATIYYCITGKLLPAAMDRIDHEELQFPENMKEPLSPKVISVLKAGLAVKPEERIQSVEELYQGLKKGITPKPIPGPKPKYKRLVPVLAGVFAFIILVISMFGRGSSVTVERMGNSNANIINYGGFAAIPGEYEYFIGADNALYMCSYNEEDKTFYMGDSQKVSDFGAYINLSEDYVYYATTDYVENSICRMKFDGTETEKVVNGGQRYFRLVQYAELSDGKEYLYYLLEKEPDGISFELYRYDLAAGTSELLTDEDVYWFNLYNDSIFMIQLRDKDTDLKTVLVRTDLQGGHQKVLDDESFYTDGFVEDDIMLLYSLNQDALIVCNLEGEKDNSYNGFYECGIDTKGTIGYGNGWVYYSNKEDQQIHRVRSNGTGDRVAIEGHTGNNICYDNNTLWFLAQNEVEQENISDNQLYIASADGSYIFDLFEPDRGWRLETEMIPEFDYEKNEDGDGIIITGYHGARLEFQIPEKIEGLPVTEIAQEAFMESEVVKVGLPEGVQSIGDYAFYKCQSLEFIGLPDGLEVIGEWSFGECHSLTEVNFPESLISIGELAFCESMLSSVYIPENLVYIGAGAFALHPDAELTEYEVSEDNWRYFELDGVLYGTLKNDDTGDAYTLLWSFPQGREGDYSISSRAIAIQKYAFAHCYDLTSVEIPKSVIVVFENAFFDCEQIGSISVAKGCKVEEQGEDLEINYY